MCGVRTVAYGREWLRPVRAHSDCHGCESRAAVRVERLAERLAERWEREW